jgi:2-haloacid dehalogenase
MSYKLILFDADETLFDFTQSEIIAFQQTMEPYVGRHSLEKVFDRYKKLSRKLWARVEKGKVNNGYLKVERFRRLKRLFKMKYDPQQVSGDYLDTLANQSILLPGALELCRDLHKNYRLGILTNGIEKVQRQRLAESPIKSYIDFMVVSEECGFAKPDPRIFKYALEKAGHTDVKSVLMVGDRLEADIAGAEASGIDSCWYNISKRAPGEHTPSFEIHSLEELIPQIENRKNKIFWEENAKSWAEVLESNAIASRSITGPAVIGEILKRQPATVLDIGCGDGWLCEAMSDEPIQYFGIDGSKGLIDIARARRTGEFQAVSYEDILAGWQPSVPMDVIVFNFSILEENPLHLLKQVRSFMSSTGTLIVQTLNPRATQKDEWQIEDFKMIPGKFKGTMPWFSRTLASWQGLFKQANFELEEMVEPVIEERPASMIFILKKLVSS